VIGPIDGVPLDTLAEVIVAGLVLPIAWILHPRVFRARTPRVLTGSLFAWKLATWLALTQQGLCATFALGTAVPDHSVLRRSWDFRTPATGTLPQCSAVLTRSLHGRAEFPAWFLNLPIGADWNLDSGETEHVDRPADPRVKMYVEGYLASRDGVRPYESASKFAGDDWRFDMPGEEAPWRRDLATVDLPSSLDRIASHFWFVAPLLTLGLAAYSSWHAVARLRIPGHLLAVLAGLSGIAIALGSAGDPYPRALGLVLATLVLLRFPWRLQNTRAVVLFIGVPLLAMIATIGASQVGRFTIYSTGDDWQTFQRFTARIYFQGYWLEGGEPTFWQQPLYRWIAGLLHVVFGDSSVGELYWDGFCLLAIATLTYVLVRPHASHRWGLAASVATVSTLLLGPTWYLIGRGLSEFSGALWLSLAIFALVRARHRHLGAAAIAGVLATLAVYTRLNHLILVIALVVLLLPSVGVGGWIAPGRLLARLRVRAALLYGATVALGLALFAWRTWFYTGHFSVLYGTTRQFNSTGLGLDTIGDPVVWRRVLDSVLMVITVSDPPRLDPRSVLVVAGVGVALLGLLRTPWLRDQPLAPAVLCLAAVSSAFIARGLAYPGRFSVHLIPLAISVTVLCAARLVRQRA
jgi:hypothetical protein